MEAWGTKKSWTTHFNACDSSSGAGSKVNSTPVVFTDRSTANKSSPLKSRPSPSPSKIMRGRGIVFELEPVPMDSEVDPSWDLCFNCWKPGHSHKDCKYPKYHDYCRNCGRRGVNWTTCPRCAKGYRDYQQWRLDNNRPEYKERERPIVSKQVVQKTYCKDENDLAAFPVLTDSKPKVLDIHVTNGNGKNPVPIYNWYQSENKIEVKPPSTLPPAFQDDAREINVNMQYPQHSAISYYQETMSNLIFETNHVNQMSNGKTNRFDSLGESVVSSEGDDYKLEDYNLDDMIVDEGETNSPEEYSSHTVQDFLNLIEIVKHLPIETQNIIVEQFAKERKLQSNIY